MRPPLPVLVFLSAAPPAVAQQDCTDIPEWRDSLNDTCSFYSSAMCRHPDNAAKEYAGFTGDTACCECGGGYQADDSIVEAAQEDNTGASTQDLQRTIPDYPGKAAFDSLAGIEPPDALHPRQLRRNRATLSYIHWGVTNLAYDNYTRFYNDYAEVSDEFGAISYRENIEQLFLTFDAVVEELPKTPGKEVNGTMIRMGDLGGYIFNHLLWDVYDDDWTSFPIGTTDVKLHRVVRPLADYLMGSGSPVWNRDVFRVFAEDFLETRNTINNTDLRLWTNKVFHKIFLDIELTDQDAQDFEDYKAEYIVVSVLPTWLASSMGWAMNLESVKQRRMLWINRYVNAIQNDQRGIYAQFQLEGRNLRYAADFFLTAFTAAGGISLPSTINHCLALVQGAGPVYLQGSDRILRTSTLRQFVYETMRYFPLVVNFPMWYPDLQSRVSYAVGMAIRDPRVWNDPWTFQLRPLSEYHQAVGLGTKIGVGFAEQARGYDGLTPDSRGCPAQEMAVVCVEEFLKVYMRHQDEWSVLSGPEEGIFIGDDSQADYFTIHRPNFVPVIPTSNDSDPVTAFAGVDTGVLSSATPRSHRRLVVQAMVMVVGVLSF